MASVTWRLVLNIEVKAIHLELLSIVVKRPWQVASDPSSSPRPKHPPEECRKVVPVLSAVQLIAVFSSAK